MRPLLGIAADEALRRDRQPHRGDSLIALRLREVGERKRRKEFHANVAPLKRLQAGDAHGHDGCLRPQDKLNEGSRDQHRASKESAPQGDRIRITKVALQCNRSAGLESIVQALGSRERGGDEFHGITVTLFGPSRRIGGRVRWVSQGEEFPARERGVPEGEAAMRLVAAQKEDAPTGSQSRLRVLVTAQLDAPHRVGPRAVVCQQQRIEQADKETGAMLPQQVPSLARSAQVRDATRVELEIRSTIGQVGVEDAASQPGKDAGLFGRARAPGGVAKGGTCAQRRISSRRPIASSPCDSSSRKEPSEAWNVSSIVRARDRFGTSSLSSK